MCGIVGLVGRLGIDGEDPLGAALACLAPRGPDGSGRRAGHLGPHAAAMGCRRLALSAGEGGRQPHERRPGSLLVFNGEVYNRAAIRRHLEDRGEVFRGGSEAEVLAALLAREGADGLARVEGSYALAWLPGPEGPLVLARDPLGVRPLVFVRGPEGLAFASTLDALVACGALGPEPDLEAVGDVLRDGVVPARRTALRGAERVAPGQCVEVDASLGIRTRRIPAPAADEEEDLDVLEALRRAVRDRLRLARPAGVFLSGGVDSALVAALARERAELPAYTLAYPGMGDVDEAHRARRTARRLGLEHLVVTCPRDPTPWVLATAEAFDEPFADASAVPTWGLALAAGRRVRAVLTGTGGDEVFGGYRRYWLLGTGPWMRHVPTFLRAPLATVLQRGFPPAARLLHAAGDPQGLYRGLLRLQPLPEVRALMGPRLRGAGEPRPRRGPATAREAMAEDLVSYLPDDLLTKEDRALMAHAVEGRHPFLDRRVRRAARSLEHRGGVGRGRQKHVLRAYVREVVDPDLARTPKHGFAFPVDALYRGPLRPLAEDLLASRRLRDRGFVAPSGAVRVLRDHQSGARNLGAVVHALVMLELWARRMLDGEGRDRPRLRQGPGARA